MNPGRKLTFLNRRSAGKQLAERLLPQYGGRKDVLVLALPRGGVPVAYEIAKTLNAPLDVMIVRKLGVPGHEELAMGAIASSGVVVMNDDVVAELAIPQSSIDREVALEKQELRRRNNLYRGDRSNLAVKGKIVILVDDGVATGATMRAAIVALKQLRPARLIAAVPSAAESTYRAIAAQVDEFAVLATADHYYSVGSWYVDFAQVSDREVRELLANNRHVIVAHKHTNPVA